MKALALAGVLLTTTVSAQGLFAPGAVQYPSPAPRAYLDQPVLQCVIARPCPWGECVILSACPAGTVVAPPQVMPPVAAPAPPPAPKEAVLPEREPVVVQVQPAPACPVCPVCEAPAAKGPVAPGSSKSKAAPAPRRPCP